MQTRTDAELLGDYAVHRSESAFGEIVRRYADFVYSAALRQVGDAEQARDVAQTVFVDLARKAGSLRSNTVLIGWLCQGARLAALEQRRKDQRRLVRERQAMELLESSAETPNDWNAVRPVLDEAIATLGHEDRDALLLRFFRNESLASVGATLGVSEDAAQKRVSRALERLREFLAGRGIRTTAAALSAALIANGVQAAPGDFAGALAAGALADAGVVGTSAPLAAKWFALANLKAAVPITVLTAGVLGLTAAYLHLKAELRDARTLADQRAAAANDLRAANEQLANLSNQLDQLRGDAQDVLRLRAEVTALRQAQSVLKSPPLPPETNSVPNEAVRQINFQAKFIALPARDVPPGELTGILTEPQMKDLIRALEQSAAPEGETSVMSAQQAQVTTLSGRQAQIQMRLDRSGTNEAPGLDLALDVLATCATNSSVISLDLAVVSLLKFDPAGSTPGSSVALGSSTPADPAAHAALSVPTTVPRQAVSLFQLTNSIAIPDGQTLLVTRKLPDMAGSSALTRAGGTSESGTLAILLTPTLIDPAGNRLFTDEPSQSQVPSDVAEPRFVGVVSNAVLTIPGVFPGANPDKP